MAMVRKQIYLDKATDQRLKREAKKRGISQAALIRERVEHGQASADVAFEEPEARQRLLEFLARVQEQARPGPGTGWKFDREELYAERTEKARPVDPARGEALLKRLRKISRQAAKYQGPPGRKFNREELYDERLTRQLPR